MKLLILSSNNGQGHNTAARALLEAARKQDIEAVMMDGMLFDSPKASERVARIHVRSALYAPHLFEKGTRIARRMEDNPRLTDSLQRSGMAASPGASTLRTHALFRWSLHLLAATRTSHCL